MYREVGELIYETLVALGPTFHCLSTEPPPRAPTRQRSPYLYLLEIPFSNIGAHYVLAKQNSRWQEKEQPLPGHLRSPRQGDDPGIASIAITLASQKTKLKKILRSKTSLRQAKINQSKTPPPSRCSNNYKLNCRAHSRKEIGWWQPSLQTRG